MDSSSAESNLQEIVFKSSEVEFTAEVDANNVRIHCSAGTHNHGSSKVKLTDIVDFNWGLRLCMGNLIAIHISGKYLAYGLKPKDVGMIRVTTTYNNGGDEKKTLIKGMKGLILDISFSYNTNHNILAFVDEDGALFVYDIVEESQKLTHSLLLNILHPVAVGNPTNHFGVMWCPYVPSYTDDSTSTDAYSKLLVLLNGNTAELFDVGELQSRYGPGPLMSSDNYDGYLRIECHSMNIVDASFSPDGTAIATAGLDGYVKFFQAILKDNDKPRCLHQWKPHDGKALSSLLFLDNVNNYNSESKFWKFMVTGARHNAEIKIWSCETWTCTQTINFIANPNAIMPEIFFKIRLDSSANYIMMSEINNRMMYVLKIHKDESQKKADISAISELLLPAPCISFCIKSAELLTKVQRYSDSNEDLSSFLVDYSDEEDEPPLNENSVEIVTYLMQPKCLQICKISFKEEFSLSSKICNIYGNIIDSSAVKMIDDDEDDEAQENKNVELRNLNDLQTSVDLLIKQQTSNQQQSQLNLMMPADFEKPASESGNSPASKNVTKSSPMFLDCVDNLIDFQPTSMTPSQSAKNDGNVSGASSVHQQDQQQQFASGGSSPSREVQEILSLSNTTTYTPQEFFENLKMNNSVNNSKNSKNNSSVSKENGLDNVANSGGESDKQELQWPNIPTLDTIEKLEISGDKLVKKLSSLGLSDNRNSDDLSDIKNRLSQMEALVQQQSLQLRNVEQTMMQNSSVLYELSHSSLPDQLTQLFEHQAAVTKRADREHLDHIALTLSKKMAETADQVVSREMTDRILPAVSATFEQLQRHLEVMYSKKIAQLDQLLKANLAKVFNNKALIESNSTQVVNVLKPSMEQCYREMINNTLVPSWERVTNNMFQQINTTFTRGTQEYTSSLDSYMTNQTKSFDKELLRQLQTVTETIKFNAEQIHSKMLDTVQNQITCGFTHMESKLEQAFANIVRDEVSSSFQNHVAQVLDNSGVGNRSRSSSSAGGTSAPSAAINMQAQLTLIQYQLSKGNYSVAFQHALDTSARASDVSLVLFLCENVNPQDVFGDGRCLLPQPILLSLIQQLSVDLTTGTEIKYKYLEESLLNLDMNNQNTKEHAFSVLRELLKQLSLFISKYPTHKSLKNMRMLQMAAQSILAS